MDCEISTSRGDICVQWSFSTRPTLTDFDVLPPVHMFLRGGNFTSRGRNKYVLQQLFDTIEFHGVSKFGVSMFPN